MEIVTKHFHKMLATEESDDIAGLELVFSI